MNFKKSNLILAYSDYEASNDEIYILKYDETLIENYKVLIQTIDNEIIESKYISHPDFQLFKKKYDCTEIEYIYLEEDDIEFDESEDLIIIEDFTEEWYESNLDIYEDSVNNISNRIKQLPIRGEDEIA